MQRGHNASLCVIRCARAASSITSPLAQQGTASAMPALPRAAQAQWESEHGAPRHALLVLLLVQRERAARGSERTYERGIAVSGYRVEKGDRCVPWPAAAVTQIFFNFF